MLGLAFLGMALSPGPKSEALSLMWGSLLFVTPAQLVAMGAVLAVLLAFVVALDKELRLVLYSRELAAATIPEGLVFSGVLLLAASVITVNGCHPGDANSALSNSLGYGGHETPEEAADTPVWLATDPALEGVTGKYFAQRRARCCEFAQDEAAVAALDKLCAGF